MVDNIQHSNGTMRTYLLFCTPLALRELFERDGRRAHHEQEGCRVEPHHRRGRQDRLEDGPLGLIQQLGRLWV